MVHTSVFGMGIDQSNIKAAVHTGCLPTLEQLVQEFGHAAERIIHV